jgi:hypothetical protein
MTAYGRNEGISLLFLSSALVEVEAWAASLTIRFDPRERTFCTHWVGGWVEPIIRRDLSCPTVKEDIRRYSSHYGDRLRTHPNHLAVNLLRLPDNRRLRQFLHTD